MTLAHVNKKITTFLASSLFFKITLGFFILSSAYVALVSLYPMAFDEDFHIGVIRAYSEVWSPFSLKQLPAYDKFGALVADPSYMYHYLMSFPYRLLHHLTGNESAVIIALRFINIGFCVAALMVFRKLLREAKVPNVISNITFACLVLLPVMPLLAGQVNYDNLLMLILAVSFLWAYRIRMAIVQTSRVPVATLCSLIILLAFSSVVKYAFLPIAVAIAGYVIWVFVRSARHEKRLVSQLWGDTKRLSNAQKWIFSILFVIGLGLFAQRYVVNTIQYKNPVPDCAAVLNEQRCMAYGPWGRDYLYEHAANKPKTDGPVLYTLQDWSWGMWHRVFFTLAGPTNLYDTKRELPVASRFAIGLFVLVVLASLWYGRSIVRKYPVFTPVLVVTLIYVAALWQQQYGSYVQTGQPVAINGRYLLPLLPVLAPLGLLALSRAFTAVKLQNYKGFFAAVSLMVLLQGGGPFTYIVRSEPEWFWQNSFTQDITNGARTIVRPFTLGD